MTAEDELDVDGALLDVVSVAVEPVDVEAASVVVVTAAAVDGEVVVSPALSTLRPSTSAAAPATSPAVTRRAVRIPRSRTLRGVAPGATGLPASGAVGSSWGSRFMATACARPLRTG
ncbi:hypothetical protein AB0L40_22800 [Patulibacter sp. NPDC049589]|uniref:hypothetical protein n=1 Tax=Patulibacter sp. NPDC049589 TaxID=3154731 RepID=UPI0034225707